MIFSALTGFSGLTENGKTLPFGCSFSDGASRSSTRHSRRVRRESVRLFGVVGLVEAERLAALRVPVAALLGDLPHVRRGHEEVGLRQVDLADPRPLATTET